MKLKKSKRINKGNKIAPKKMSAMEKEKNKK